MKEKENRREKKNYLGNVMRRKGGKGFKIQRWKKMTGIKITRERKGREDIIGKNIKVYTSG